MRSVLKLAVPRTLGISGRSVGRGCSFSVSRYRDSPIGTTVDKGCSQAATWREEVLSPLDVVMIQRQARPSQVDIKVDYTVCRGGVSAIRELSIYIGGDWPLHFPVAPRGYLPISIRVMASREPRPFHLNGQTLSMSNGLNGTRNRTKVPNTGLTTTSSCVLYEAWGRSGDPLSNEWMGFTHNSAESLPGAEWY